MPETSKTSGLCKIVFLDTKLKFVNPCNYPQWVPKVALIVLEEKACIWAFQENGEIKPHLEFVDESYLKRISETLSRYVNCFKSGQMEYSWKKADSWAPGGEGQLLFALMLWESLPYVRAKPVTKGEAESWKGQLLDTLTKAESSAYEISDNMMHWLPLWRKKFNSLVKDENPSLAGDNDREYLSPHPHELLRALIDSLQETHFDPLYYGKHIHSRTSDRQYFVRKLTSLVLEFTGEPNRRLVAETVSVAFECNYEEREVIKATKEPFSVDNWAFRHSCRYYLRELHSLFTNVD